MRLISLECDRQSFKTIRFRAQGLSLIVGDASEHEGSSNGVGKTFALNLVHHCLGARKDQLMTNSIPDWRFSLKFELNGQEHSIERNGDGSDISLDGQMLQEGALRNWLDTNGPFELAQNVKGLSFRALYRRFARVRREDRADPVRLFKEEPHQSLLLSLYCLGIDVRLVQRKADIREKWNEFDGFRRLMRKRDPRLRQLIGDVDGESRLRSLQEETHAMRQRLDNMHIVDDYELIQKKANSLSAQFREMEHRVALIDYQLNGITQALELREDTSV